MKLVASLLVGTLSIRVTRNVLARNRRRRRLLYLPRPLPRAGRPGSAPHRAEFVE